MRCFFIAFTLLVAVPLHASTSQDLPSADEYSQRGIARFEKNDLDGAIKDFTKVIELKGQNLEFCYYFRGMAHYRKGNIDLAVADLTSALAIKSHPRFYFDRGNLLAKQGKFDAALADLNKAVELSPNDAKAYADRGLIRVMRGEDTLAESDFKKSFELDRNLEPQIRTAAKHIKQRNIARQKYGEPSDVTIVKFSWNESPTTLLAGAPSPIVTTSTTNVSATGTRIMADPRAKGDPGPHELLTPGQTAPDLDTKTKTVLDYKFSATLKNTGSKTIVGVQWGYILSPKNPAQDPRAYVFSSKTNIAPGKEKTLSEAIAAREIPVGLAKLATKYSADEFNAKIVIIRLDYSDGSRWENSASQ